MGAVDTLDDDTPSPDRAGPMSLAERRDVRRRRVWLSVLWLGLIVVMLRPTPHTLSATLPNDLGDPNFVTWTMRWGWRALLTEPLDVFDAPIYHPYDTTLAYSDSLLSFAPVYGALEMGTGDHVLALNLFSGLLFLLSLVSTYVLVRWLFGRTGPAVLAAAVFTFTSYSLGQPSHVQVLTFGMFPLAIWLLLRWADLGRWRDAVAVGAATVAFVYGAVYYALLWALVAPAILVVLAVCRTRIPATTWKRGAVAMAGAGVLCLPAALNYLRISDQNKVSFAYVDIDSLLPRDLITPAAGNDLWGRSLDSINSMGIPGPHAFMLGLVAYALAALGIGVLAARRGRVAPDRTSTVSGVVDRSHAVWAVLVAAVGSFVVGVGPTFSGIPAPYRLLHRYVPGFDSIRVASRLSVVGFLGVAVLVAIGATWLADWAGRRTGRPKVVPLVFGVLLVLTMAEVASTQARVEAWEGDTIDAVYAEVAALPDGAVLEWPLYSIAHGFQWPFVEAPRMALSAPDADHPRVNGYSGHWPGGYVERGYVLNTFPSEESLALLDEMGVRFVVVHTTSPWEAGAPLDQAAVDDVLERIPDGLDVTRAGEAWIVDLGP